jgi:hypothetical protein
MSISPVGNSDAYDRYRQQQLNLLAAAGQADTQTVLTPQTTTPDSPDSGTAASDPVSSSSYAAQFKADLSALNSPQGGTSGPHGAHGHHHHGGGGGILSTDNTDITDPDSTTDTTDGTTSNSDPFTQALDAFADVVKETADTVTT